MYSLKLYSYHLGKKDHLSAVRWDRKNRQQDTLSSPHCPITAFIMWNTVQPKVQTTHLDMSFFAMGFCPSAQYMFTVDTVSVEPHFTYLVLTPENEIEPARKSPWNSVGISNVRQSLQGEFRALSISVMSMDWPKPTPQHLRTVFTKLTRFLHTSARISM